MPEAEWFRGWQVVGAASGPVGYVLLSAGTELSALDLEPLLVRAYGPEQAQAGLALFESMLSADQDAWILQRSPT